MYLIPVYLTITIGQPPTRECILDTITAKEMGTYCSFFRDLKLCTTFKGEKEGKGGVSININASEIRTRGASYSDTNTAD